MATASPHAVTMPSGPLWQSGPAPEGRRLVRNEELQLEVSLLILEQLERGQLNIPPLPRIAVALSRLVVSRRPRLAEVVRLVERDAQLAGRVRRLAHLTSFGEDLSDLGQAIARIGLVGVRNVALSVAVTQAFRAGPLETYLRLERRHAYITACGAASLAFRTGGDPAYAFLCGLVHDVGCAALIATMAHQGIVADVLGSETLVPLLHQMHSDIGPAVLAHWGFTDDICDIARLHHLAHRHGNPSPTLRAVALADAADELPQPSISDRLRMLLDHPVRHQARIERLDLVQMLHAMDDAASEPSDISDLD